MRQLGCASVLNFHGRVVHKSLDVGLHCRAAFLSARQLCPKILRNERLLHVSLHQIQELACSAHQVDIITKGGRVRRLAPKREDDGAAWRTKHELAQLRERMTRHAFFVHPHDQIVLLDAACARSATTRGD